MRRIEEEKGVCVLLLLRMQKMGMAHGIGCDAQINSIALCCWADSKSRHELIVVCGCGRRERTGKTTAGCMRRRCSSGCMHAQERTGHGKRGRDRWIGSMDEFRSRNSGGAWALGHAIKFSNPSGKQETRKPQLVCLVGDGVIIFCCLFMLHTITVTNNQSWAGRVKINLAQAFFDLSNPSPS